MASNPVTYSNANIDTRWMNYTGKDINATAGSRNAYGSDLIEGDVLVLDPYGHDNGKGRDLATPTTGHFHNKAFVVVQVPKGSERGGSVLVAPAGDNVPINVTEAVAIGDYLILKTTNSPKASQYDTVAVTVATTANIDLSFAKLMGARVGIALTASGDAGQVQAAFGKDA